MSLRIRPASPASDLVFHALAFVPAAASAEPAARAASLFWPAYVARAHEQMEDAAYRPLEEDAALLSELLAPRELAHGVGWLAELFETLPELLGVAQRDLAALHPSEVRSPMALAALTRLPREPLEILRADLALVAPAFGRFREQTLPDFGAELLSDVERSVRGAGRARALMRGELCVSLTLGPRGRGFPARIYAGSATLPRDPQPSGQQTAVLALHEACVQAVAGALSLGGLAPTWECVEAGALALGDRLLSGSGLVDAYQRWTSELDRSGLAELSADLLAVVDQLAQLDASAEG